MLLSHVVVPCCWDNVVVPCCCPMLLSHVAGTMLLSHVVVPCCWDLMAEYCHTLLPFLYFAVAKKNIKLSSLIYLERYPKCLYRFRHCSCYHYYIFKICMTSYFFFLFPGKQSDGACMTRPGVGGVGGSWVSKGRGRGLRSSIVAARTCSARICLVFKHHSRQFLPKYRSTPCGFRH